MLTTNPFSELVAHIPPVIMQAYVIVMVFLVVAGTLLDMKHKKSASYFFENARKASKTATRTVSAGEKFSLALKTAASEVMTSSEFCNPRRRLAHLLTMYGFILFVVATAVMIFAYPLPATPAPALLPLLWHLGALMVCVGGYWFWFFIRVDVAAEGYPWYRVVRADLFILSLLATTSFALIWSALQAYGVAIWTELFFVLFIVASTVLFGSVMWSKFAHMFFKPAAAYQKRLVEADGSRENLPPPADKPARFGPGINRELPRHY